MKSIVTTEWLAENIDTVKIIDASWYLPNADRDPKSEFPTKHIEGAVYFDIDEISDQSNSLPHMVPSSDQFSAQVSKLGLSNSDTIVVYDTAGLFSAARVWWLFKTMGHAEIYVLDGGLPKWISEGQKISSSYQAPSQGDFQANLNASNIYDAEMVLNTKKQIIDARPLERFKGEAKEPRPNTRSGHIPGSTSVFFKSLLDDQGCFLKPEEIHKVFENAGIDLSKPIVTTCGSGVTASVLALALHSIDHPDVGLYDGSWSEWGARDDLPISTG